MANNGKSELTINLYTNDDNTAIYYVIDPNISGTFIDINNPKSNDFVTKLSEVIKNKPDFFMIYKEYNKIHSTFGQVSKFLSSAKTGVGNVKSSISSGVSGVLSRFSRNQQISPTEEIQETQNPTATVPATGGKKTKSKRSYNANKTLKNRK